MRRTLLALAVLAAVSAALLPRASSEDGAPALIGRLESEAGKPEFWKVVARLEAEGRQALPDVEEGIRRANPYVRIGCAKVLFALNKKADAVQALLRVAQSEEPRAAAAAADLLANLTRDASGYGDTEDLARQLKKRVGEVQDPAARIALARALWSVTRGSDITPLRTLRETLKSPDPEIQLLGALALAEMDDFGKEVVEVLQRVARAPDDRGRLAGAYLLLNRLGVEVERKTFDKPSGRYALLDEILSTLRGQYVEPDKVVERDLIDAAAKGMASALDPYTGYLDEKDRLSLENSLNGKYGGIGARVALRKDQGGRSWLTIERPIYSGPAYRAGLRSMDQFVEIAGESAVNRDLDDLVSRLRGEPGSTVKFKVYRRGWKESREYELIRERIAVETVIHEMLPGGVGYLHLTTFGPQSAGETDEALQAMEGQGLKMLILDLRSNSGGLLKAAVEMAEKFLPKDSLVVTVRARESNERHVTRQAPHPALPLVVLMDDASASASEILAGALQHYGRATCVGERTYGKGSVQQLPDLQSTPGVHDALRLTIAKYYLPSGRSPQKEKDAQTWGIEPDVKAEPPERDFWKDAAYEKIRQAGKIDDYVKEHLPQHKDLFRELANDDGGDPGRYPDLAKFLESLDPPLNRQLTPNDLRELVRDAVRRWAADERGKDFNVDIQLDVVLQRGILEALKKAGVDPKTVPAYARFEDKLAAAAAKPDPAGAQEPALPK